MTFDTFVNRRESGPCKGLNTLRLTASKKIPDPPGVFVEVKVSKVDGDVAVKTNEVVCQFKAENELSWLSLAIPSICPFAKSATEVAKPALGFFV